MIQIFLPILSFGFSGLLTWLIFPVIDNPLWWLMVLPFALIFAMVILSLYWLFILIATKRFHKVVWVGYVSRFFLFNMQMMCSYLLFMDSCIIRKINFHKINKKQPALYLFNHTSDYDCWVMFKCFPHMKYAFVGKKALKDVPVIGNLTSSVGTLILDRDNPNSGYEMVDHAVKYITEQNTSVLLAPEGHRNSTGTLLPFKHGGFHIALRSHCPIVLVGLKNIHNLQTKKLLRIGRGSIEIIKTIYYEEYQSWSAGEIADYCYSVYVNYLKEDK